MSAIDMIKGFHAFEMTQPSMIDAHILMTRSALWKDMTDV
jgi:hypothetical protein